MLDLRPILSHLVDLGGSDLHLGANASPRVRVNDDLRPAPFPEVAPDEMSQLVETLLPPDRLEEFRRSREADFSLVLPDIGRFRGNACCERGSVAIVLRRVLPVVMTAEALGLPPIVTELVGSQRGMVLVTGPTGSGKTTSLAAMVDHINKSRACHVLTIEDPVEFVHVPQKAQITHREIGPHASTYAHAIRSAGREDPDVILIGELRTNETMKLALQLASFGILVFATVHTNSAAATIDRIVNAFPADEQPQIRGMLSESLAGIVAQQLVRSDDGKRRLAVHEILLSSPALASMIRENKTFQVPSLMQAGQAQGMQTMDMALERLVRARTISVETALEKALDKESFAKLFKQNDMNPL